MSFVYKKRGGEIARSLKVEACADCTRRCSKIHGKNNLSVRPASFFKFLIGDGWEHSMPLPPTFACAVPRLENKKTQLIDSDGKSWEVLIRRVGGCISFQRGWNDFVVAHGLRSSYVLNFDYIEPHFVVKIYNETACEQVGFSGNCRQSKRPRTNSSPSNSEDSSCFIIGDVPIKKRSRAAADKCQGRGKASDKGKSPIKAENPFNSKASLAKDTTWYTIKESLRKGQCSGYRLDVDKMLSQRKANDTGKTRKVAESDLNSDIIYEKSLPTCKASCFEEPFYMIGRDLEDKQCEDKNPVLDLSDFETGWNRSGVAGENIAAIKHEISPPDEVVIANEENLVDRVVPSSAPDTEIIREETSSVDEKSHRRVDASPRSAVKSGSANKEDGTVALPSNTYGSQTNFKGRCSENVSKSLPDKRNCHGETSKPPLAPSAARPIKVESNYATRSSVNVKECQVSPGLDNTLSTPLVQNGPVMRFQKEGHALIDSGKILQQTVIGALKLPTFHVQNRLSGETMLKAKRDPTEAAKTEPKVIVKSEPMRMTKTEPKMIVKSEQVEITPRKPGNYEEMLRGTEPLAQNDPVMLAVIDSGKSLQQTVIGALKLPIFHVQNRVSGETMVKAKREHTEAAKTEPKAIVKCEPTRMTKTEPKVIVKSEQIEITPLKLGNYEEMLRGTGLVKTELLDCSVGASSLNTPTVFSVVVTRNLHSLELPTRLPSATRERRSVNRKVVYLRDPLARLWPVLYHDRLEFRLITAGWEAFCKANGIWLGDKCTFEVKNGPKDIYKVSVLRN